MNIADDAPRRRAREVWASASSVSVPVDVDLLAGERGIGVTEVPSIRPGVFGAFYIEGSSAGILVSKECFSPGHRRFTVAHELGHFVLDGHVEALLPVGSVLAVSMGGHHRDQHSQMEREADAFASELLMPLSVVDPMCTGAASLDAIGALASACCVSLSSAAIRFVERSDVPAAVVLSHEGVVEWFAVSPVLREHSWARQRLKGAWIPKRSATSRLEQSTTVDIPESESTLLCEWFPDAPGFVHVDEECVRMGGYGRILTLLLPRELPTAEEVDEKDQRRREREREENWRSPLRSWHWD